MIHATAIVDAQARIGNDVQVGAYAVIGAGVELADAVRVESHAQVIGATVVGQGTYIGQGALIGGMPQMMGLKENTGRLVIGKNNIFREYVTIHTSTAPEKTTSIGDNNFFMGFSHVAHDCCIGNNVVLCNGALIAGHAQINDGAFISGDVAVHQFVRIGRLAMIGGLSRVNQDVPPFMMVVGDSRVWGLNMVGLKRRKFNLAQIAEIKQAFNAIYRKGLPLPRALAQLRDIDSALVKEITDFIESGTRGICGPQKNSLWERIFLDYPYYALIKIQTYRMFAQAKK